MKIMTRKRALSTGALVAATALTLAACGGSSDDPDDPATTDTGSDAGTPVEEVTLSISTFNEFGYEELIEQYMADNPHVTIVHNKAATSSDARDNLNTGLAAGSGLNDIEAAEVDWIPELMQYADAFNDLTDPELDGRWLDWKVGQVTTADGKVIGYGTDIGPTTIAYRADLFDAAGLPTDRDEVADLFGGANGSWDDFFAVAQTYVDATGEPFYDASGAVLHSMIQQTEVTYEDPDSLDIIAADNADVRAIYDSVMEAANAGYSANLQQWTEDWNTAFQTDGFAVMIAPGWMLGVIEGNAAGIDGWDLASAFPGGGLNWGGSFLTVPAQSEHPDEAKALAAWLTAPEQQIVAFESKGTFPSQVDALSSDVLLGQVNAFFNDAPTGEILADQAAAVSVVPFKGPRYFQVHDQLQMAVNRVDVDGTDDAESSWAKFVEAIEAL